MNPQRFVRDLSMTSPLLISPPQIFNSEVRYSIAAELEIADDDRADLLFQQADQISDEEAEEIMREVLEEHRHSTSPL
jgi:hypothetical protein